MQGYCEALRRGPRFLSLDGWAEVAAFVPGTRLIVRAGETIVADAAIGGAGDRGDLTALGGAAFSVTMPVTAEVTGPLSIVLSCDGVEHILRRMDPSEMLDAEPRGHIDSIDAAGLRGWVADPAGWLLGTPPRLRIGPFSIDLPLNEMRNDLSVEAPADTPLGFRYGWDWVVAQVRGIDPDFTLAGTLPIAIEASGRELGRDRHAHAPRMSGRLERVQDGRLIGWAVDGDHASDAVPIDLLIDGVRYDSATAAGDRHDLRARGITLAGGGFRLDLPTRAPGEVGEMKLGVRAGLVDHLIDGEAVKTAAAPPRRRSHATILQTLPATDAPAITIVVPIFRAAPDVARCIAALTRNTRIPARLLLIDDASDDPALDAILADAARLPNVTVVVQPANRGYTATCNHGIALAGRDDVVLLNSDTMVTPGWLEGLRIAAYSEADVATVTPLSDNAGAFSAPEHNAANRPPAGFDQEDMARLVRQSSLALMPAMPTGNGFCLYIRRDALDRIGPLDEAAFPRGYGEENDLCMRAWRSGLLNLVDDRSYVHHRRSASFGAEKSRNIAAGRAVVDARYPEYRLLTGQLRNDPDMLAIRWRLRRALARASAPPRPRILYVISTTSGGTPQTNADLMAALADRYEPWVLRCDSRILELSRWTPDGVEPVETTALERPLHAAVHRSGEYDGAVADLLIRYGFELVHIRHIAWHGLGLPEVCKRLGIPAVFSFHDFYTVCPTTKLLDERQRFCGGTCTAGEGTCQPELWPAQSLPPLKHRFVHRWRETMAAMIDACDAYVTTSPGARETMVANYPQLADRDFRVIPHARDFPRMETLAALPNGADKLRVLVPGNISAAKGADLIVAIAALDSAHEVEFHILGDPGRVPAGPGVIHHGRYARGEFADAVRRIGPHVGAILSIWPETYSHTLTEMWAAGLPVVALDTGAVGERIAETGAGWLFPPDAGPQALLDALRAIRADGRGQRARAARVADWQMGAGHRYDTPAMAAHYDRLYREILRRRLAFAGAADAEPMIVLVQADHAETGLHATLSRRTRNAIARDVIYRPLRPDFAWAEVAEAGGDATLLSLQALAAHQLTAACDGLPRLRVPLVVDIGDLAPARLSAMQWDVLRHATLVLSPDAETVAMLAARGLPARQLDTVIDAGAWRGRSRYRPDASRPLRLHVAGGRSAESALALTEAYGGAWSAIDEAELIAGDEAIDLIVIDEQEAAAARRLETLSALAGVPFVSMAEDEADSRITALLADPLARDAAATAAGMGQADDWLPRFDDPLDTLFVGLKPARAAELDEAA